MAKVNGPVAPSDGGHEADLMRPGAVAAGLPVPHPQPGRRGRLAARGITAFSTDCIPRTTRAQAMDTLSSQANIVGYKGVLLGAVELPRYFPMLMTSARLWRT